jgi:hypothetical protein
VVTELNRIRSFNCILLFTGFTKNIYHQQFVQSFLNITADLVENKFNVHQKVTSKCEESPEFVQTESAEVMSMDDVQRALQATSAAIQDLDSFLCDKKQA